jgi:hypothetical protein
MESRVEKVGRVTKAHLAEVVSLYETNYRDPVATLRKIADEIEAGNYGPVGCLGVVVLGDQLNVFGAGPDSEAPSVGMVLHAGFMQMSQALVDHGQ